MEFFFMVILVAAALAVASIKKKPQSYYRKRNIPTWAAPEQILVCTPKGSGRIKNPY